MLDRARGPKIPPFPSSAPPCPTHVPMGLWPYPRPVTSDLSPAGLFLPVAPPMSPQPPRQHLFCDGNRVRPERGSPPSPNVASGWGLWTRVLRPRPDTPLPSTPNLLPDRTCSRPSRAQNPADLPRPRLGVTWAVQPHLRPATLVSRSRGVCPSLPAWPHLRAHKK